MTETELKVSLDALTAAIGNGDGDLAVRIIQHVAVDHPQIADETTNSLINAGLNRLVNH